MKKEYFEMHNYIAVCKETGMMKAIFKDKDSLDSFMIGKQDTHKIHVEKKRLYKQTIPTNSFKPSWLVNLI